MATSVASTSNSLTTLTKPGDAEPICSTFSGHACAQAVSAPAPAMVPERKNHVTNSPATTKIIAAISQRAAAGSSLPIGKARNR